MNDELKNGDPDIKQYLALTIGAFNTLEVTDAGSQKPLEVLSRCLDKNEPLAVREAAAESLARIGARLKGEFNDSATEQALADAAKDPEAELRLRSVFALGFMSGEKADLSLEGCLRDESRFVAYNAAAALARRDNPKALPLLKEMLDADQLRTVFPKMGESELQNKVETVQLDVLKAHRVGSEGWQERSGHDAQTAGQVADKVEIGVCTKPGGSGSEDIGCALIGLHIRHNPIVQYRLPSISTTRPSPFRPELDVIVINGTGT